MKNIIILCLTSLVLILVGCQSDPCKGVVTYSPINPAMTGYIFKQGSYWVYSDTVDGIIDSQYVYSYIYKIRYNIDPLHQIYQTISPGGIQTSTYCGPYYADSLFMIYLSYRNSVCSDTLALSVDGNWLYTTDHYNEPNHIGVACFYLGYTQIGSYGYQGLQDSVVEGNSVFTNVNVYQIKLDSTKSTRFANPTDLYFCSGYGIVKIIEHRPTGNVPWILLRYHIAS